MALVTTYVKYNGEDLTFGGTQAAPFVSQANEYVQVGGGTWVILKKINLTGTLVGCGQAQLVEKINQLRSFFNEDFHTLQIEDVEDIPCIKVLSLDFGESQFLSNVNYTISLQAYDEASLASSHKVIDPSERIEFSQSENETMQKIITVSAKGISCGSNNALANAKGFVEAQFTERQNNRPALIPSADGHATEGYLSSVAEEINRIDGTYSLAKTFISDLGPSRGDLPANFNAAIILRYSKELGQTRGEYAVINYTGEVNYGIDNAGASTDAHKKIETFINETKKIDYRLIGLDINEDKFAGTISFSFQLTEDNIDVVDDWSVSISENSSSSLIQVSINGLVTAKGPRECRWAKVEKYFGTNKEAKDRYYGIAASYYNDYGTPAYQHGVKKDVDGNLIVLNNICMAFQISTEEKNGEISYSFNFDNRLSKGYYSFDYTINIAPSIWKIAASPSIYGRWVMLDLGYRTRARFDIHGQFVAGENAVPLKPSAFALKKYKEYAGAANQGAPDKEWYELEEATVMKGVDKKVGDNFAYGWSFLAPKGVTQGPAAQQYITPLKEGLLLK